MDHPLRFGRGIAEPGAGAGGRCPLACGTGVAAGPIAVADAHSTRPGPCPDP